MGGDKTGSWSRNPLKGNFNFIRSPLQRNFPAAALYLSGIRKRVYI